MANTRTCDLTLSASLWASNLTAPLLFDRACFPDELFDPSGSYVSSDGATLRLKQSSSEIAREVVSWAEDSSTGAGDGSAEVWAPVAGDAVSGTTVTAEYGGSLSDYAATDTYGRNAVWTDYDGVWHLSDGSGSSISDSTANGYDGTLNGSYSWTSVKIGDGIQFGGGYSDYGDLPLGPISSIISTGKFTYQIWTLTPSSLSQAMIAAASDQNGGGDNNSIIDLSIGIVPSAIMATIDVLWGIRVQKTVSTDTLYRCSVVYDGSVLSLYVDGSLADSATCGFDLTARSLPPAHQLALDYQASRPYSGPLDDYRVASSDFSADRISTEYANQNSPSSFVTVGTPGNISSGYTLTMGQGSFALTGEAVAFSASRLLALAQGSFTLSGQPVGLIAARSIGIGSGSFALTGQALGLAISRYLAMGQGTFALTGESVGLVYSGTTYQLAMGAGSFALTGEIVGLKAARLLGLGYGDFTVTGENVGLYRGLLLTAGHGSYALTGEAAGLKADRYLALVNGAFTLTGEAVGLSWSGEVISVATADRVFLVPSQSRSTTVPAKNRII